MNRIFYYSGYRLTVFHWNHKTCISSFAFDPGEEGLEKFKTYLRATVNTPVRILVDLIEEDFKKETIPHVGYADRKAIVGRLINRQYRKSKDYVHYKVANREKTGRKDDILLYSVLSNPEILEPWLEPMREAGTSISGIWSLPLLTHHLYPRIKVDADNVLLVTQQVPSNLRQTFLKNGHFESSRSAVVNLEEASIGEYIAIEIEQTVRFLSNQRHIGFDEKIEIHVICRSDDVENIQNHCIDTGLRTFKYHSLTEIEQQLKCKTQSAKYCNSIYSYICSSQAVPIGHYGSSSLFVKYYEQISAKVLYAASVLILLSSIILAFGYSSESVILEKEALTLQHQAEGINIEYNKTLAKLESKLGKAKFMQSSVLLTDKIQESKRISPQNFMVDISRILTRSGMNDTEITSIQWHLYQSEEIPNVQKTNNLAAIDFASNKKLNQYASIAGFIRVSNSSLKESVDKANAIADALKSNKKISQVNIKRLPVDIRSKSSIENETSANKVDEARNDLEKGKFEIKIIMQDRKS